MLKQTPFHPRAVPLNQSWDWRRWAGYIVASKYEMTHEREYYAIRNSATLIDVSPLYKYEFVGADVERFFGRLLIRDIRTCKVGQAQYTCWCNEDGEALEDGVILRLADERFRLTVAEPNLAWFEDNALGYDVTITDISEQYAILAVQGPHSRTIIQQLTDIDISSIRYYGLVETMVAEQPALIVRAGFTGDLGYEIWVSATSTSSGQAEKALTLWDALMHVGAGYELTPAGMLALDVARIEAGLLLLDVDFGSAKYAWIASQRSSPLELGFEWMLRGIEERRFIGRNAIRNELQTGSTYAFVGLEVDWLDYETQFLHIGLPVSMDKTAQRHSIPLYADDVHIGYATSHTYSPLLKKHIALATIKPEFAQLGTQVDVEVTIDHVRKTASATVVKLPFFNPRRKRL